MGAEIVLHLVFFLLFEIFCVILSDGNANFVSIWWWVFCFCFVGSMSCGSFEDIVLFARVELCLWNENKISWIKHDGFYF